MDRIKNKVFFTCAVVTALLVLLALTGCRSGKVVVVTEHHMDTLRITKEQRDSIWLHDSVFVREYARGETIYVEVAKWRTKYVEKLRIDTIYEAKVDSVPVPYPVEKKVSRWQRLKMRLGGWAMGAAVVALLIGAAPWVWRR